MAERIGPEAKIIRLFSALPEDSKRIVLDMIKSQQPKKQRAKGSASPVAKKSSPKGGETKSTPSIETDKGNAGVAASGD